MGSHGSFVVHTHYSVLSKVDNDFFVLIYGPRNQFISRVRKRCHLTFVSQYGLSINGRFDMMYI
jgi:hypothetical protein